MTNRIGSRRYFWRTLRTSIGVAAIAIAGHQLVSGDRGLLARQHQDMRIAELESELGTLQAVKVGWQRRVDALGVATVDVDMLREQATRVLYFSEPDEVILSVERED